MKIQVSVIVGPILLLSLAARCTLAEDAATTEDVATVPSNLDLTTDMEHTQLDRGLTTAVEPEEIFEVGSEDKADEYDDDEEEEGEGECYGEDDGDEYDEDDDEYDQEDDEYDQEDGEYDQVGDECDQEDGEYDQVGDEYDQEDGEYDEYDEDMPYADDEDIEPNGIDPDACIDAASQEAEGRENVDFSAQAEETDAGIYPVQEDPLTESFSTSKPSTTQSSLHKRDEASNKTSAPTDQDTLSSLATAEPGGACIDSFVNFALRFQDHCTIFCLKTFTHIFAKPNVLGVLDCFGCSNFIVQGFIALGQDCVGLFTSDPMTPEDIRRARESAKATPVGAPAPTGGVKPKDEGSDVAHVDDGSQLRGAEPLNLDNVISSLQNVDMDQVHEWLEIGKGVVSVINAGATNNKAQEEQPPQNGEVLVETQASEQGQVRAQEIQKQESPKVDKNEFNEYIIKAAKFANWDLTPKMIDDSGVYDRVHESGVF
ncbi:hypothetical protein BGZ59_003270 [Podila verticillata]|nr:hypothetical protein BGZ59_003270 [Podila verticillata]